MLVFLQWVDNHVAGIIWGLNLIVCLFECLIARINGFIQVPYPAVFSVLVSNGMPDLTLAVQIISIVTESYRFFALVSIAILTLLASIKFFFRYLAKQVYGKAGNWLAMLILICIFLSFINAVVVMPDAV